MVQFLNAHLHEELVVFSFSCMNDCLIDTNIFFKIAEVSLLLETVSMLVKYKSGSMFAPFIFPELRHISDWTC